MNDDDFRRMATKGTLYRLTLRAGLFVCPFGGGRNPKILPIGREMFFRYRLDSDRNKGKIQAPVNHIIAFWRHL